MIKYHIPLNTFLNLKCNNFKDFFYCDFVINRLHDLLHCIVTYWNMLTKSDTHRHPDTPSPGSTFSLRYTKSALSTTLWIPILTLGGNE